MNPIHFKQDKLLSLLLDTLQKTIVDMSHKYYTVKIQLTDYQTDTQVYNAWGNRFANLREHLSFG